MKNLYYVAALAAIGLASCTNEEIVKSEPQPESIAFKGVCQKTTRGAVTVGTMPLAATFRVFGYHQDDTPGWQLQNTLFTNREFTNASNATWTSPSAVYPPTGSLDCIAYSCLNYKATTKATNPTEDDYKAELDTEKAIEPKTAAASTINVTDPVTNKAVNKIDKLVLDFTDTEHTLNLETDVMFSNKVEGLDKSSGVTNLSFRHALAWVTINFTGSKDNTKDLYKVKNVRLNGVKVSGKCTIDYTNGNAVHWENEVDAPAYDYTYNSTTETVNAGSIPFTKFEDKTYGDAAAEGQVGVLIVPGVQGTITFEYAILNADGETYSAYNPYTIDLNKDYHNNVSGATELKWEFNTKYLYNISFNAGDAITFTALIDSWSDSNLTNGSANIGTQTPPSSGTGSGTGGSGTGTK